MSQTEIRATVLKALGRIAPEVGEDEIDPRESLREQADLDSMDFMNLVVAVGQDLGIEIPEDAYPELATLDGFVAWIAGRAAQPA
ncbi:MAG TPA: acyl carrier protein [Longimicrobium sp.]|nr:acyl carrier protein [Longimicrobium sp.]